MSNLSEEMSSLLLSEEDICSNLTDQCWRFKLVNHEKTSPLKYAFPLYGIVAPIAVALTLFTNSFIAVVLTRKHLRTPTNYVLLAMAITELCTGLVSTPWFMYYYTFEGYAKEREFGTSGFWCLLFPYLVQYLPTIFHTSAIWLTVFLAIQRYIYVCVPRFVPILCTRGRTKICILIICIVNFLAEIPAVVIARTRVLSLDKGNGTFRDSCVKEYTGAIRDKAFLNIYMASLFWFQALFMHLVPCFLLAVFTGGLIRTIRRADRRRRQSLFRRGPSAQRSPNSAQCMKYFHATTQMLIVIIIIFLLTEIPATATYILHIFIQTFRILPDSHYKSWIQLVIMLRNVLIIVSYPFNFAIYCGMSQQFRFTVLQLFTQRPLFIQQPVANYFRGGKRYSVVLVGINELKNQQRNKLRASIRYMRQTSPTAIREEHEEMVEVHEVQEQEMSSNGMPTYNLTSAFEEGNSLLGSNSHNGTASHESRVTSL